MVYTLYILCLPDLIYIIYFSREEGMVDMVGYKMWKRAIE